MSQPSGARVERPSPAVDHHAAEERRQAARALMRQPMLHSDAEAHADELRLVRRHREELTHVFADGLGYRLVVEPGTARLFKAGLGRDATRPLLRRSKRPFAPRGYALLCLTVAALSRCKGQLLVDELVSEVRAAAADAGVELDLDGIVDRRALHGALLALTDLGVLAERDGDLEHWAEQRTLALLDVRRDRLALLVSAPIGSAATARDLLDVAALPSAAGGARVAIRRLLCESPVLSVTDLTPDQSDWWAKNRHRERDWYRDRLGLEVELRAEGALAVDPREELTDEGFPGTGSARHFALLWLESVAAHAREEARGAEVGDRVWRTVSAADVAASAARTYREWGSGLKREYRDDERRARADATTVLVQMGLVRVAGEGDWRVHAAAARYAALPALVSTAPTGETSLFDDAMFDVSRSEGSSSDVSPSDVSASDGSASDVTESGASPAVARRQHLPPLDPGEGP